MQCILPENKKKEQHYYSNMLLSYWCEMFFPTLHDLAYIFIF